MFDLILFVLTFDDILIYLEQRMKILLFVKLGNKTRQNIVLNVKKINKYFENDIVYKKSNLYQGNNARTVISEVYASFVLQCTVSGR